LHAPFRYSCTWSQRSALALDRFGACTSPGMTQQPHRRHVHTRSIRVEAYVRDDGLWDLEASLVDTKSRDLELASGLRAAGEPVHDMTLKVTIDTDLNVRDAEARTSWVPYPGHCDRIEPAYKRLVGLNLAREFHRHVRERLGGTDGCTHLTELASVLPTAAIQAFAGENVLRASHRGRHEGERRPFQLDRCHALVTTGPAVAEFYPRWYRGPARGASDAPSKTEHGETR
jgi:hypothetical protein